MLITIPSWTVRVVFQNGTEISLRVADCHLSNVLGKLQAVSFDTPVKALTIYAPEPPLETKTGTLTVPAVIPNRAPDVFIAPADSAALWFHDARESR